MASQANRAARINICSEVSMALQNDLPRKIMPREIHGDDEQKSFLEQENGLSTVAVITPAPNASENCKAAEDTCG
jgi:hypothetical protein